MTNYADRQYLKHMQHPPAPIIHTLCRAYLAGLVFTVIMWITKIFEGGL